MFDNNTKTEMAMEAIYSEDPASWEEDLFDSTEYAMELDKRNPVLEGVIERLKNLNICIDSGDRKGLIKELNRRYRKIGISEGLPKSVKNWLEGTPVNPSYRSNLYNLCIALEMNIEEIRIFFLKNYMTIPFNFKDRVDASYFWGISHQLPYSEIQKIICEAEAKETQADNFDNTGMIGKYISEIDDMDLFLEYLKTNSFGKNQQYITAANEVYKLSVENASYAEIERTIKHELNREKENKNGVLLSEPMILKDDNSVNYKALLFVIYGFDNQERYVNRKSKIAKCKYLPKAFRENFPNDQEFSRIVSKEASPDVYRKALVILKFYNFFCSSMLTFMYGTDRPKENQRKKHSLDEYRERDIEDIEADLEDFYYETGKLLEQCGFEQMYARNPFDWLILYCAKSTDPLDTLRELLTSRFIDMEED